jgi:YHS domain-containing protein
MDPINTQFKVQMGGLKYYLCTAAFNLGFLETDA